MKKLERVRTGISLLLIICLMISCKNGSDVENPNDQLQKEVEAIDTYLDQQGIVAIEHIQGVRMQVLELGTGFPANINSTIDADYSGKLFATGATFDQGNVRGALKSYIRGWHYAFTSLPAGSRAILYIPSFFAYGKNGQGTIPPDATLIFEVTFNEVVKTSTELQKLASDTVTIDNYLADKNIPAVKDATGLRYVITTPGSGPTPDWFSKVKINVSYKLLSDDAVVVATFNLEPDGTTNNLVIDQITDGLKLGLQKLQPGSKATLYVPSGLGFGTYGAGNGSQILIPANSNIIIDVELISIVTP